MQLTDLTFYLLVLCIPIADLCYRKTLIRAAVGGGQKKSCFDLAENRAAVSLWVGAHRYQRDLSASKLLWV